MKSLKPKEEVKIKHNILIKMLDEKKRKTSFKSFA